ncbi:MAG: glutamine-hydrolyzing carbamoyl-phosphate synthase small subunit [Flavobacteriales bacterium]
MDFQLRKPALLVLDDGTVFQGRSIGAEGTTTGEICFNTGMTGYQEIFTDPSYYGQIMVMATAHIGNYGMHENEIESDSMKIAGLVCKNFSDICSRYGDKIFSAHDYFKNENMVGISEVDTRALVRHIRKKGAMNAVISSEIRDVNELKKKLKQVPSMEGLELSSKVTTNEIYDKGTSNSASKVALIDYGVKKNIIRNLVNKDCYVRVFPMHTKASDIEQWEPDGVMLSNGPGDPASMKKQINEVKQLVEHDIPVFGICLGHQLLALSQGLKTKKMHSGHRGINHPVKNLNTGKDEITSQNHGFVVTHESINENDAFKLTHEHLNDNSVAGFEILDKNVFSVQYHPEANPGPHDPHYLFDRFIDMIGKKNKDKAVV